MTILLGDFFRKSLELSAKNHISLNDELSLISEFLTIEQVRFGSRLHIEQDVQEECRHAAIPPLLLQPLVENAVRHGIAHRIDGGTIHLHCKRHGEQLRIIIENPIDIDRPRRKGTGLGLKNVRSRLRTLYGNDSRLDIEESNDYFRVTLSFPIHQ